MIDARTIAQRIIQEVADGCRLGLAQHEAKLVALVQRAAWAFHASQERASLLLPKWRPEFGATEDKPVTFPHRDKAEEMKYWAWHAKDYQWHFASLPKRQRAGAGHPSANYTNTAVPATNHLRPVLRAVALFWARTQGTTFNPIFRRRKKEWGDRTVYPYELPSSNEAANLLARVIWHVCDERYSIENLRHLPIGAKRAKAKQIIRSNLSGKR